MFLSREIDIKLCQNFQDHLKKNGDILMYVSTYMIYCGRRYFDLHNKREERNAADIDFSCNLINTDYSDRFIGFYNMSIFDKINFLKQNF